MNFSFRPAAALVLGVLGAAQVQSVSIPIMVQPPQWQIPVGQIPVGQATAGQIPAGQVTAPPIMAPASSAPLTMPPTIQVTPGSLTPPAPPKPSTPPSQVTPVTISSTPAIVPVTTVPAVTVPAVTEPSNTSQFSTSTSGPALPDAPAPSPSFTFQATPTLQTTSTVSVTSPAAPETWLLWGGTSITGVAAGLSFGASYPVAQLLGVKVLARGTGDLGLVASDNIGTPLWMLRADALASYALGGGAVYGGPGIVAGKLHGLGLTVGYQAKLSNQLGGFLEGQFNRYWNSGAGYSAPGLRTGVTYRF